MNNSSRQPWKQRIMTKFFTKSSLKSYFVAQIKESKHQRIIHVNERTLRIAQKDYEHDFGFLTEKTNSVPIHISKIRYKKTCSNFNLVPMPQKESSASLLVGNWPSEPGWQLCITESFKTKSICGYLYERNLHA